VFEQAFKAYSEKMNTYLWSRWLSWPITGSSECLFSNY